MYCNNNKSNQTIIRDKFNGMSYTDVLNKANFTYLGGCKNSTKELLYLKNGCLTYMLYLAPSNLSGYQVCPNDKYCKDLCLNGSGQNKMQIISKGIYGGSINQARIKKTKLFYENREMFMYLLIHEIKRYRNTANKLGISFAVRLNGTSDLSPELFRFNGENILQIFPDIQFYDYTKVVPRLKLVEAYKNYDLTFSYNGHNWNDCETYLNNNGKISVVFENRIPKYYRGYKVNDANGYDMRFLDNKGEICGLKLHKVGSQYDKNGNYLGIGDTNFIVKDNDVNCIY